MSFRFLTANIPVENVFHGNWHQYVESFFPNSPSSFYFERLKGDTSKCRYLLFQTRSKDHPAFIFAENTLHEYANNHQDTCYVSLSCRDANLCGKPYFFRYYAIWRLLTSDSAMFPHLTHIFYMDSDAMIVRNDYNLSDVIEATLGSENDLSISTDNGCYKYQYAPVNSGSFIYKMTETTRLFVAALLMEWTTVYPDLRTQKVDGQEIPYGRFSTKTWEQGDQSTMTYLYEAIGILRINALENQCRERLANYIQEIQKQIMQGDDAKLVIERYLSKHPLGTNGNFTLQLSESESTHMSTQLALLPDVVGYPLNDKQTSESQAGNAPLLSKMNVTIFEQAGGRIIWSWLTNGHCRPLADVSPEQVCQPSSFVVHFMGLNSEMRRKFMYKYCSSMEAVHKLRDEDASQAFCRPSHMSLLDNGEEENKITEEFATSYLHTFRYYLEPRIDYDALRPRKEEPETQFCIDTITEDYSLVSEEHLRFHTGSRNEIVCQRPSIQTSQIALQVILNRRIALRRANLSSLEPVFTVTLQPNGDRVFDIVFNFAKLTAIKSLFIAVFFSIVIFIAKNHHTMKRIQKFLPMPYDHDNMRSKEPYFQPISNTL